VKDEKLKRRRHSARLQGLTAAFAAALLLFVPAALFPASAQSAPVSPKAKKETLLSTERALKNASKRAAKLARDTKLSEAELSALRQHLIAVAARTHDRAATVTQIENRIADLRNHEYAQKESLRSQRGKLASLIAALQRIATHSPTALIALPAAPADTIRSALLLRGTVPAITARARTLAQDLEALTEVRTALVSTRIQLDKERKSLQQERAVLESLIIRKARALKGTRSAHRKAAKKAAQLGLEASSLRDLVSRLGTEREAARRREERDQKASEALARQTQLREEKVRAAALAIAKSRKERQRSLAALSSPEKLGNRAPVSRSGYLPVPGRIIHSFRALTGGTRSDGITIRSRPGATVTASHSGIIVFAGPFKGLGNLLIIEHQGAYHLLLAGLARIDAAVGEKVLAGEPVGVMSASGPAAPTLYLELRRKGQPVNPTPWLASRRNRKNG
jgi:murein hydrolase activator